MKIPLSKLLKRQFHADIAFLQDEVVEVMYSLCENAVLHGGTAIWRCYKENRFSEDLDFYAKPSGNFREKLGEALSSRGLSITKFKQTENTVFAKISGNRVEARLEIALRDNAKKKIVTYERADGSSMDIYSLSAEELLSEKIKAYLNRRLVRDLYDVFFLSSLIQDFSPIKKECLVFLKDAKMPVDEKNLKALVYSGVAPPSKQMMEILQKRLGA